MNDEEALFQRVARSRRHWHPDHIKTPAPSGWWPFVSMVVFWLLIGGLALRAILA